MAANRLRKLRTAVVAILTIATSTASGVLIAEYFMENDRNTRSVRSEMSRVEHWIGGFDIHIVTVIVAVIVLLGIAFFARSKA